MSTESTDLSAIIVCLKLKVSTFGQIVILALGNLKNKYTPSKTTTNKITIKIDNQKESYTLEIKNAMGQSILNRKTTNRVEQVDLSGRAAGIYFVKLKTENNTIVKKIIKQN